MISIVPAVMKKMLDTTTYGARKRIAANLTSFLSDLNKR